MRELSALELAQRQREKEGRIVARWQEESRAMLAQIDATVARMEASLPDVKELLHGR